MTEILVIPSEFKEDISGGKFLGRGTGGLVRIDVDTIGQNLSVFMNSIAEIIPTLPTMDSSYRLEEIEFTVEVNGEGGIQLIGGLKVGASGGITIRLRRHHT